jgi:hypothetical protein
LFFLRTRRYNIVSKIIPNAKQNDPVTMNIRQIAVATVVLASASVTAFAPQASFRRNTVALDVGGGELTAESIMEQVRGRNDFSAGEGLYPMLYEHTELVIKARTHSILILKRTSCTLVLVLRARQVGLMATFSCL